MAKKRDSIRLWKWILLLLALLEGVLFRGVPLQCRPVSQPVSSKEQADWLRWARNLSFIE